MDKIAQSRKFMAAAWETQLAPMFDPQHEYEQNYRQEYYMCGHCASNAVTLSELSDHTTQNHIRAW